MAKRGDLGPMRQGDAVGEDEHGVGVGSTHGGERRDPPRRRRRRVHRQAPDRALRGSLRRAPLRAFARMVRVRQDGEFAQVRQKLLEELDPLGGEVQGEEGGAGEVAAGPRQALGDAELDRIAADREQHRSDPWSSALTGLPARSTRGDRKARAPAPPGQAAARPDCRARSAAPAPHAVPRSGPAIAILRGSRR